MPPIVPISFASLTTPSSTAQFQTTLINQLAGAGFPSLSWSLTTNPPSVPACVVNLQAQALQDDDAAVSITAKQGLNDTAVGDSLTLDAAQMYGNTRFTGLFARGYVTLTDAGGAGPFTISASAQSYSVGLGGLVFNAQYAAATQSTSITLPKSGTVDVVVQAAAIGTLYNVATSSINLVARAALPGVTVTNPADWLTKYTGSQVGVDPEGDTRLKLRNTSEWGILSTGSVARAYVNWALNASQQVQQVIVYSNFDIFNPGCVSVVLAASGNTVGPDVVAAVQNFIAPSQQAGRIPYTARCVVSAALVHSVDVSATLYVQSAYNTTAFQQQTLANLQQYFAGLAVGAFISYERIIEVLLYQAGVAAGIIVDATVSSPSTDVQLGLFEVAVLNTQIAPPLTGPNPTTPPQPSIVFTSV